MNYGKLQESFHEASFHRNKEHFYNKVFKIIMNAEDYLKD